MKNFSYKIILSFLLILFPLLASAQGLPQYSIEGAGVGTQGTYLVKVTVTSKKSNVSEDQLVKCAVHGVLFRGFSSKENRQSQKPLAGSALSESKHADFYNNFFQSTYLNYAQVVEGSRKVVKSGKEYNVSVVVTVLKSQLKKDLVDAGIVEGLKSGF